MDKHNLVDAIIYYAIFTLVLSLIITLFVNILTILGEIIN